MKLSLLFFFLIALFVITGQTVLAQTPTQAITGFVKDNTSNESLIGANVIVMESDPLIGTITDMNGKFRLENAAVGYVSIKITYVGYHSYQ